MMDRKALRIFVLLLVAMTAAAAWRLTLPDWRSPAEGPGSHDLFDALALFSTPLTLLTFLIAPCIQWLSTPEEIRPSVQRYNGRVIVAWSLFWFLFQAFILSRSLGLVSGPSDLGVARGGSVMIGLIFLIIGNFIPKTPVPPRRNRFQSDPWKLSRMYRFTGRLFVGLGLAFVLGGLLLPLEYWEPVFTSLMLAALGAGLWYGIRLHRERALQ